MHSPPVNAPATARAASRGLVAIERLLAMLTQAIDDPTCMEDVPWTRCFSHKDSIASHLQRLVSSLAVLSTLGAARQAPELVGQAEPLNEADRKLFIEWLIAGEMATPYLNASEVEDSRSYCRKCEAGGMASNESAASCFSS